MIFFIFSNINIGKIRQFKQCLVLKNVCLALNQSHTFFNKYFKNMAN